jgi:predicted nucleic-acid-binding protein
MEKRLILDANAILRYLLRDDIQQADIVAQTILNRNIHILPEVLVEVIYIMVKVYDYTKTETARIILTFLNDIGYNDNLVINAVKLFGSKNFAFVDCILSQYAKQDKYEIFTFDKKLKKLIDKS